ncbi:hypothetical protein L6164_002013 [Bauhinia variegata]|uniref:Uncharacterized protein n=1 Tax=Bauhinia variegata TaxID=167791 RepID=A0ACB9PWD4_BAUVA|nr:hypothetical protein L6164_002013 [Bauhinia variegata]
MDNDACLPLNAVNSYYFQCMIDAIASMGAGYKGPNCHSLRGREFTDQVLDSRFWRECAVIDKISETLIHVLRLVDSEGNPAMGYLYAAIHKARDEMIKRFQRRKKQ